MRWVTEGRASDVFYGKCLQIILRKLAKAFVEISMATIQQPFTILIQYLFTWIDPPIHHWYHQRWVNYYIVMYGIWVLMGILNCTVNSFIAQHDVGNHIEQEINWTLWRFFIWRGSSHRSSDTNSHCFWALKKLKGGFFTCREIKSGYSQYPRVLQNW